MVDKRQQATHDKEHRTTKSTEMSQEPAPEAPSARGPLPLPDPWKILSLRKRALVAGAIAPRQLDMPADEWTPEVVEILLSHLYAAALRPYAYNKLVTSIGCILRVILGPEAFGRCWTSARLVRPPRAAPAVLPAGLDRAAAVATLLAEYVKAPETAEPTAAIAAALCLALSRKGQDALPLGPRGGFPQLSLAQLKAREADDNPVYPLTAVLGADLVRAALRKWSRALRQLRADIARDGVVQHLMDYGVYVEQLGAIGLQLAAEAAEAAPAAAEATPEATPEAAPAST